VLSNENTWIVGGKPSKPEKSGVWEEEGLWGSGVAWKDMKEGQREQSF
jgi:hypothetical protein